MKKKSLIISSLIILVVTFVFIVFLEGFFSYFFSSKYFKSKKEFNSYVEDTLLKNQESSLDPYNQKLKSVGRTISNRLVAL